MEFLANLFQVLATFYYILFWCAVAGFACFVLYGVFRTIRQSIQEQHEAELLDRWHARNKLIQAAVMDLDSPDPLQRILAETFIDSLLP